MSIENEKLDAFISDAVQRYGALVFGRCRAILRSSTVAEDAFQQTFIRFTRWLRKQPAIPGIETVSGLVLTMAERAAIDVYRQIQRQERRTVHPTAMTEMTLNSPSSEEISVADSADVNQLLDRLSARERRIVELSVLADVPAVEIGRGLGLSEGAVRVAKFRALKKLRSLLEDSVTPPGRASDE